ncbi:uncharacterized protein EAF01_011256 [Botrytis porri]|uniref:RING-type domain-containing protein n=1 Tax=Botrytis porri TaxID=87229 RepID=A0A4Z1KYU2_9HELO|nr:uncharacterized protein EAF01_011256 [Botrytis porri]KAF7886578.1 hypothetical protein EAF01_011256 [Botrytis porri]TGO89759.1 hypothetical protein BPOR_0095g00200 [Botrytis porri]
MSSGQSNNSAAAEIESSGQQNTSGNAESLALQENIMQDEASAGTSSHDNPEDTESSDSDDNEELSGGLTNDGRSGTSLQTVVPQDAAVEDMFPEGLMDTRRVVEALVFYTQELNNRNGSGANPASTIEIHNEIPVQTIPLETMNSFHEFYASIRPHQSQADINGFYARIRPNQSHADIEEIHRNQAIDELLTPVLIDETQAESVLCPICNEKYDSSAENGASHGACMVPDCKHVFGRQCINRWLKEEKKNTCPMCRAAIEISTGSSDDDDD